MKFICSLIVSLLASSSLYAYDWGTLGLCVYKYVPNSSNENQIYRFRAKEANSSCMKYEAEHAAFNVVIPPNGKPGLHCDVHRVRFENHSDGRCWSLHSYIGFSFESEGGGSHASTSGRIRFYAPADHNEVWFEGGVDKSMNLCLSKGLCHGDHIRFYNGNDIYVVYDGDK